MAMVRVSNWCVELALACTESLLRRPRLSVGMSGGQEAGRDTQCFARGGVVDIGTSEDRVLMRD